MSTDASAAEDRRIAALHRYAILETLPEQDFDDLAFLAAHICQTPIAMINFIDGRRQWSKSQYGIAAPPLPREDAFCATTIAQKALLIAPDTRTDERFKHNPFVTAEPRIQFYAGAPLVTAEGCAIGSLCVLDYVPRSLDETQQSALTRLSRQVVAQLELRHTLVALERSRQEMRSSATLLQAVLQGTADSIFVKDLDGRYLFINQAGAKILGRSVEEMLGRRDDELFEPDAVEVIATNEHTIVASGRYEEIEEQLTINGRDYTFLTTKDLYRNHEGEVAGIIGVAHDITERVAIERALWHSQQHMAGIVALSTDAIISIDEQQRICLFNRAAEEVFGYKAAEILGQPLDMLIPAGLRDRHAQHVQKFNRSLDHVRTAMSRGVVAGRRRDGSEFPLEGSISKVTVDGAAIFTVCLRDLTEPLRVQEQLRLLDSAVRHTTDAIVITSADLDPPGPQMIFANPAFLEMTGYAEHEVLGATPRILQGPKTDRAVLKRLREQLTSGEAFQAQAINYRKDGGEYVLEWNTAPLFDSAGKITHFVAVQRDISRRRAAEAQIQESQDRLQQYAHRLQNMYEISQWVLSASSLEMIAQGVVRYIQELIPSTCAYVMLFDFAADRVRTLALNRYGHTEIAPVLESPLRLTEIHARVRSGEIILDNQVKSAAHLPRSLHVHLGSVDQVRSFISVPFVSNGRVFGALNLIAEQPEAFTPEHLDIAREITSQLAVAIQNAELFEQVQAGRDRLTTLSRSLIEVQENERRHLARELHDEIGQALTAIKINLNNIDGMIAEPAVLSHLDDTTRIVGQLVQQIRSLSLDLRPSMLDDLGLISTLRWYLDRQSQRSGIRFHFSGDEPELPIAPSIATACFRIVQESTTNILRYARASEVAVELRAGQEQLALVIQDNGVGFDVKQAQKEAAAGRSSGILGMQERAVLLGGECAIRSSPVDGTRVEAYFPFGTLRLDRRKNRR